MTNLYKSIAHLADILPPANNPSFLALNLAYNEVASKTPSMPYSHSITTGVALTVLGSHPEPEPISQRSESGLEKA